MNEIMFVLQIIGGVAFLIVALAIVGMLDKINKELKELIVVVDDNALTTINTLTLFNNNFVKYQQDIEAKGIKIDSSGLYD